MVNSSLKVNILISNFWRLLSPKFQDQYKSWVHNLQKSKSKVEKSVFMYVFLYLEALHKFIVRNQNFTNYEAFRFLSILIKYL